MNGPHDLGGSQGFGPVLPEADEPIFHAPWEMRVFALTLAMGATGVWNLDMARSARESLPPAEYLSIGYYRIWFEALCRLMCAHGLIDATELSDGHSRAPGPALRVLQAPDVPAVLLRGSPTGRPVAAAARFAPGARVRVAQRNPQHHTRVPRYIRGQVGEVVSLHGPHVFPDTHAQGLGEQPQWLYTVRFSGQTLWGPDTTADSVCVDCFESSLEASESLEALAP